jgi:hypothetical protein
MHGRQRPGDDPALGQESWPGDLSVLYIFFMKNCTVLLLRSTLVRKPSTLVSMHDDRTDLLPTIRLASILYMKGVYGCGSQEIT